MTGVPGHVKVACSRIPRFAPDALRPNQAMVDVLVESTSTVCEHLAEDQGRCESLEYRSSGAVLEMLNRPHHCWSSTREDSALAAGEWFLDRIRTTNRSRERYETGKARTRHYYDELSR